MSDLIDRKRFSADMRDFQNRVGIWRDEADDTETRTRADAALATIIETKLILDKQPTVAAASPWHRVEEPPREEGRYWCATKFAGHWIFYAAWYWNNVSDYIGAPVGEGEKADGFVFSEDVVYPDYWMPIEPPKEDA